MWYKFLCDDCVIWTQDKVLAKFMNKRLTFWERVDLFFSF